VIVEARGRDDGQQPPSREAAAPVDERAAAGGALLCAACGFVVTHEAARIDVDGAHAHVRTNPHGFTYEFGCFSEAPGAVPQGAPSMQATWFPGHFWWVRVCGGCQTHLGWLFFRPDSSTSSSDGGAFYALILARLRAAVYDSQR